MPLLNRRDFLAQAALGGIAASVSSPPIASAIDPIQRTGPSHLKPSLDAYSFRDHLAGPKKRMDLFEFIDRAADMGLDAVEPTSYYFPEDVTDEYLHRLKQHAFLQGLDISGTAIRNDFCLPPGDEANRDREHMRAWIGHAAELDAPVLRVMSGNWRQGTPEEELEERVARKINELLPCAAEKGVILALENHGGGVTVTAEQLLRLVRAIKGPNFGVNLDTGNFHGEDPYTEIAQAAPYAVNVQVKTEIRRKGRTKEPADLAKVIGILREARYSGYVVLEYDAAEDAMTAVPRSIETLRSLIS